MDAAGSQQSSPQASGRFARALTELRTRRGLTQDELAARIKVSRGYMSLLESARGKIPSINVLRDICNVLVIRRGQQRYRSELQQIARLALAALDLDDTELYEDFLGTLEDEPGLQRQPTVNEIWILSDVLGENRKPALLETTVANLQEGVRYAYFVPQGEGELEWSRCEKTIMQSLPAPFELPTGRLLAVACPKLLCLARIRVVNPGVRSAQGSISLGPLEDIVLHALQPEQVAAIHRELGAVLGALAAKAEYTAEDGATYARLYPKEDWTSAE